VPRTCSICTHEDVRAIDRALVSRVPYRNIAERYSLSLGAVTRHNKEHLPELLAKAHRAQEVAHADTLLERLEGWAKRIEAAIEAVEGNEDYSEFWKGVSVLRPYLETMGEITKELERRPQIAIAIVEHPTYPKLEDALARALEPYPAARWAVADAIREIEE
jgi:hypothetical protein